MGFRSNQVFYWLYLISALLYLSLAMHSPVTIRAMLVHDDAWFINNAQSILAGQWLGDFNQMTLIKGPAYSYFLALNNLLGTPITLTQALLYSVACFAMVCAMRKAGLHSLVALICFVMLIFQPALLPVTIIRDDIYFSLFLIATAGLIYAATPTSGKLRIAIPGLTGFCFGLFWITREEGVWVLPGYALIILYAALVKVKEKGEGPLFLKALAIYVLGALLPIVSTAAINLHVYGSFQIVDVKSATFANALNALNKVDIGEEVQFIPVSQKKREAIYKVSPAFRELKPYLEDAGKGWTVFGCSKYKHTCGDYAGGWFMWALRDGANSLGYYKSPELAAKYYDRISEEINTACKNGSLSCASHQVPFMPRLPEEAVNSIPGKIIEAIKLTTYKEPVFLSAGPSFPYRLREISEFLGNPRTIAQPAFAASGWYYAQSGNWIYLKCSPGDGQTIIPIVRRPSPDIAAHFKDGGATSQRFTFEVGDYDECSVAFSGSETPDIKITDILSSSVKYANIGGATINFDSVRVFSPHQNLAISIKGSLIGFYKQAAVYVFSAGTCFTILTFLIVIFQKARLDFLMVLSLSFWILYYSRVALVVLVDVSSFPAITQQYLLPAYPIWTIASLTSIAAFISAIKRMERVALCR